MARMKKEELPFEVDTTEDVVQEVVIPVNNQEVVEKEEVKVAPQQQKQLINCLRNEKIIVRHIPRQQGNITNPKHVLYGGMSNNASRKFCLPKLTNGVYVNPLTNSEKAFLENEMGLEYNALSIHKKTDNFWDDNSENGISQVVLYKQDNYLDLSTPTGYIQYKILLANKDIICPSLQELQDRPKVTYQFVIINEGDETKTAKQSMTNIQRCYKEFGKIENNVATLRLIIETITGRPTAPNTKLDWLQTKVNELIQADSKMFLNIVQDEYLETKVLIMMAKEAGLILPKGNQLYLRDGNQPLCEYNEEPTFNVAARYLNNPKHQDVLFALQAKLK